MLNTLILGGFVFFFIGLWHTLFFRINLPSSKLKNFFKQLGIDLLIISGIVFSWYFFKHTPAVNTLELLKIGGIAFLLWYSVIYIIGWLFFNKPGEEHKLSFSKRLFIDLFIGLSMAYCLSYFHDFPFLVGPEDASMDFVINHNSCKLNEEGNSGTCDFSEEKIKGIPSVALLDIDNETHNQWGEPLFTPRRLVKELIDVAVTGNAKIIVVDILTVQKSPVEGDDEILRKYLATNCDGKTCPPIIMASGLLPGGGAGPYFTIDQPPVNQLRKSFLEEDNNIKANPLIKWASPSFILSPSDGVLRSWWLWQPVCDENNKPDVLPSIQLLVAGLVKNEGLGFEKAFQEIYGKLEQFRKDCSSPSYKPLPSGPMYFGNLKIEEGEMVGGVRQRIMFTMPWSLFHYKPKRYSLYDSNVGYFLNTYSGASYLGQKKLPAPNLENNIVIIGSSHFDTKDIHKTPLKTQENDQMPGMLVVANAIYSLLLNQGEVEKPGEWLKYLVEFILIGIVGVIIIWASFVRFSLIFWLATITTMMVIWLLAQWISAYLLKHWGMWIDFSLPLVAILFHHIADELQKLKKVEKDLDKCREQQKSLQPTTIKGEKQDSQSKKQTDETITPAA